MYRCIVKHPKSIQIRGTDILPDVQRLNGAALKFETEIKECEFGGSQFHTCLSGLPLSTVFSV